MEDQARRKYSPSRSLDRWGWNREFLLTYTVVENGFKLWELGLAYLIFPYWVCIVHREEEDVFSVSDLYDGRAYNSSYIIS